MAYMLHRDNRNTIMRLDVSHVGNSIERPFAELYVVESSSTLRHASKTFYITIINLERHQLMTTYHAMMARSWCI